MNSQEFAHSNRFICGKPVVTWCKLWCKLSAKSRLYAVILTYTPSISPAVSLSGNYDLNGQRSASPCWPSAVAQQRLNRPRLKVCDSLLFTIHLLAHALAYVAYSAQHRLHSRFVRICLPFIYSLYHFFGALLLEISTEPIRSILQTAFPECSACFFQSLWVFYVFNFIFQFTHQIGKKFWSTWAFKLEKFHNCTSSKHLIKAKLFKESMNMNRRFYWEITAFWESSLSMSTFAFSISTFAFPISTFSSFKSPLICRFRLWSSFFSFKSKFLRNASRYSVVSWMPFGRFVWHHL